MTLTEQRHLTFTRRVPWVVYDQRNVHRWNWFRVHHKESADQLCVNGEVVKFDPDGIAFPVRRDG
jgi:hypothetical protein